MQFFDSIFRTYVLLYKYDMSCARRTRRQLCCCKYCILHLHFIREKHTWEK